MRFAARAMPPKTESDQRNLAAPEGDSLSGPQGSDRSSLDVKSKRQAGIFGSRTFGDVE